MFSLEMFRGGMGGRMERDFGSSDMALNRGFGDSFGRMGMISVKPKISWWITVCYKYLTLSREGRSKLGCPLFSTRVSPVYPKNKSRLP